MPVSTSLSTGALLVHPSTSKRLREVDLVCSMFQRSVNYLDMCWIHPRAVEQSHWGGDLEPSVALHHQDFCILSQDIHKPHKRGNWWYRWSTGVVLGGVENLIAMRRARRGWRPDSWAEDAGSALDLSGATDDP